ncbi:MAG: hypothetical protein U9R27_12735 [Campylobacterota bacterium]|nr:hypothetical protein [Campylobacterota bacterium]
MIRYFTALIIGLLSLPLLAKSEITINIEKIDRDAEITICNNIENREITYRGVNVEKKEKERWRFAKGNIDCPCDAKCRRAVVKLEFEECATHRWDKKMTRCEVARDGTYRFIVIGDRDTKRNGTNIVAKSSEFKIQ